ncbi:putative bifunctional diguanylate cyclase/phosphodiesterase [Azovibrio restrictus]|uniref:putative bifunctional diguanylate cyclase/phosphodiesterase n=1 Tax=Azovibrio restrictus TaxID=146938 RepID=UPI000417D050|nr:EAL domain-containing protein [Azovibrio restrictus]
MPLLDFLRRERLYALLGLLFLGGFIALLVLDGYRARERELRFAEHNLEILSRVLEGHAQASIEKIDVALRFVADNYGRWQQQEGSAGVNNRLAQVLAGIPESQSLRIADAHGHFIHDASGTLSTATITDRAYFLRQRREPGAGLVLSEPIFARITRNWVITLSRRLEGPGGEFLGLVQAAVPATLFENFYAQLQRGQDEVVSVSDLEPRLLARYPRVPERMGSVMRPSGLLEQLQQGRRAGVYRTHSFVDGVNRVYAFRQVANYPLVVNVGVGVDGVLQAWWRKVLMYILSGLFLCLLMFGLILSWQRSYRLALEEARHREQYDRLTDLPNRLMLSEQLARILGREAEQRGQIALMLLDLDHFKHVNESLGHDVGDRLLQVVAQRLGQCLAADDMVSRQGGDEFVLLVSGGGSSADLARLAERLLATVAEPFEVPGQELSLSASIGIAVYPGDGQDIQELLKNADLAMYQAKAAGRAGFRFFAPEMNELVSQRLWLESSLRKALPRQELLLHFQPQFRLADRTLVGFEALVRWQHPEEGLIPPGRFIPVAEACNLILPLGEWVLRQACRQNRSWQEQGLAPVTVAVNLSAVQFRHPDLCSMVEGILRETGLAPEYLELEITESVVMQDSERVIQVLRALKAIGLKISIDDFGTGYSSLSYLKRFPIDKIKIDRSFVQDIPADQDDAAIVEAILSIARKLGLKGIAEGVETREQLDFLGASGCEEMQGYLCGRPLSAVEATQVLVRGRWQE